ncbi:LytTr DNA-binding domain-containing protein [Spirosomataceae bacterium TFI 002]|nr:LytTr DNA-binding domain-containing protein [Spirosomataceae bacterium TFI 002]
MKTPKILNDLPIDEISHLKAAANYTVLFDRKNWKHVSSYSLKVFVKLFTTNNFIRINRSLLVRKSFIHKYIIKEGKEYIRLKNNMDVSIPRRRTEKLKLELPTIFNN